MKKWITVLLVLCSVLLFAGSKKKADKTQTVKHNEVAKIYKKGVSCAKKGDDAGANALFKQAAEKGYADAQFNLGMQLLEGKGCTANPAEAEKWLQKAAGQGHSKAKQLLKELQKKKPAAKK